MNNYTVSAVLQTGITFRRRAGAKHAPWGSVAVTCPALPAQAPEASQAFRLQTYTVQADTFLPWRVAFLCEHAIGHSGRAKKNAGTMDCSGTLRASKETVTSATVTLFLIDATGKE